MGDDRAEHIAHLVRSTYENPQVVARYVDLGLWPAEEALVLEYFPDGGRVLDVGCGAGRTTIPLAEMGFEVVGIDISGTMVAAAQHQAQLLGLDIAFAAMDVRALRFDAASFDVALFSYNGLELLPGIEGKRQALKEIARVLRPRGVLVCSSHSLYALNAYAWQRWINLARFTVARLVGLPQKAQELGERFIDDPREEVRYLQVLPPARLIRLLEACGLRLVYYNTRKRIEHDRPWSWTAAMEDGERFYVACKG